MIVCCYAVVEREWTEMELSDKLQQLTPHLRAEVSRKRQWIDRQLSIAGKLLVGEAFEKLRSEARSLAGLRYNSHHRPYFEGGSDFNIAHSGNIVICCATDAGRIGADIEQIKPINFDDYADHFTENEWGIVRKSTDPLKSFFNFWTRKEAVLKAIGTGFHTPLNSVDVSENMVVYDATAYYIEELKIDDNYPCHIASTVKQPIADAAQVNY